MAKEGAVSPAFVPWSIAQISATVADDEFLETYYKQYASIDSPARMVWSRKEFAPNANFIQSCSLMYVAKSAGSLWYMQNTKGEKQPNETLDKLELAWCLADERLTLTVTTDMLIKNGGQGLQAIRMWAKQWSFTAEHGTDGFAGCIVFGTANSRPATLNAALGQVDGLITLLKSHMGALSDQGKLIGRVEAEVLMTSAAQPSSPQASSGSPSTPQQEAKPRQDFLRADLTPLTDITPLDVKTKPLPSGTYQSKAEKAVVRHDGRLSASDYEALRTGQDPGQHGGQHPRPTVKPSEAARIFIKAGPRIASVQEESRLPPTARYVTAVSQTGTSEPATPVRARRSVSSIVGQSQIRICISPGGQRSISEAPPTPTAPLGPLKFQTSIEDDEGAGRAPMSKTNSIPQGSTPDDAHLALPQLPKIAVTSGAASPQHAAMYSSPTSQMDANKDPAQALMTMMEVAVETVNTVAQIALETVQKMSAITIQQLNTAEEQAELRRMLSAPPLCEQVLASNATQLIRPKPTPEAVSGLQGKWKVWDVRASQAGSPRGALTGRTVGDLSLRNSTSGSASPSDLLLEDETYLLDDTPVHTPTRGALPSAASIQTRPPNVPLLWHGASPFEFRGLKTESIDETPRGSPVAAQGKPSGAVPKQAYPKSLPEPQISAKPPPLLKRNQASADAQQDHEAAQTDKACKEKHTVAKIEGNLIIGSTDMKYEDDVSKAGVKVSEELPVRKPSKLRKLCQAVDCSRARRRARMAAAAGKRAA